MKIGLHTDHHRLSDAAATVASACAKLSGAAKNAWPAAEGKYRPEAHYMRGPGPKWRAKYDPAVTSGARTRVG